MILSIRVVTCIYVACLLLVIVSATNGWFRPVFKSVEQIASDKVLHFLLVGTLALLINLSVRARAVRRNFVWIQVGTLTLLGLTAAEEFSQLFFVNRTFDLWDLACNFAGILVLGTLAWPVAGWMGIRRCLSDKG